MKRLGLLIGLMVALVGGHADDHAQLPLYLDYPAGHWDDWSWASRDMRNTNPVRSHQYSIRADLSPWSAVRFQHTQGLNASAYTHLEFWVHGGNSGGQVFHLMAQVNGVDRAPVPVTNYISSVPANQWARVQVPLTALGISPGQTVNAIYFIERRGQSVPTFYLDDIRLIRSVSTSVTFTVRVNTPLRTLTPTFFGLNTATWNWDLSNTTTVNRLRVAGPLLLRFPGGSTSNEYDWRNNSSRRTGATYGTNTAQFLNVATQIGAEKLISVNYGSGTPAEARDWVQYANVTLNGNVRYWAIGNECYGPWEYDTHPNRHDAHTYAHFVRDAIQLMKAVDPTIKVGVVGTWLETDYPQRFSVTNPRTGQTVNGWSAVLLKTLNDLGVVPDFYDIHFYPQNPGREDDAYLLSSTAEWHTIVARTRQILRDYLGTAGDTVQIFALETNSVAYNPGKQTTSLVNALYFADTFGQAWLAGVDALAWWDMHNAAETGNNNSPVLYGWRMVGDYGILAAGYPSGVSEPLNTPYPAYHAYTLLRQFANAGDQLLTVQGSHPLVAVYAVRQGANGRVNLMIVNKARSTKMSLTLRLEGYTPASSATLWQYGTTQESAKKPPASRSISLRGSTIRLTLDPMTLYVLQL